MLAERLCAAMNAHDIDAFVACFHDDYDSVQPAHPGREFRGSDQVRMNWSAMFREIPDIRGELLASAEVGGVEWTEWHWHGTRTDGTAFEARGMTIAGCSDGRIGWQRLYIEEVAEAPQGIDATVRALTHREREGQ